MVFTFLILLTASTAWPADPTPKTDCFIQPCKIQGDFDGDGKQDLATLIKSANGKKGIQIKLAKGRSFLIGAGKSIGNGGDDFSWMDQWSKTKTAQKRGEQLLVEKTESASGLILWTGSRFDWLQQGD